MQNTTTVHFKRSAAPLIGILAGFTAILVASPLFINPSRMLFPQQRSEIAEKAISQPIYQEIGKASRLLKEGNADSAGTILDNQRMEPLFVTSGGYADGVMAEDSPTTLLMRLARNIKAETITEAKRNDTENALLWVARLHSLADQVLGCPTPSYDALQIAYYLQSTAYRSEVVIWQKAGKMKRAARVAEQSRKLDTLWNNQLLPEVTAGRKREVALAAAATDRSSR